ncbi:MAG: phosphonate ABC transporter, permease protein PhnE [bacterium]|nr:phosphonate ABC transporter, permease protein PhnE [bacterium]
MKLPKPPMRVRIPAFLIDACIGAYLYAAFVFIVIPEMVFGQGADPLTTNDYFWIVANALTIGTIGLVTRASLGLTLLTGKVPEGPHRNPLAIQAWMLLTITVWSGWIVTEISPIELLSGEGVKGAGRIFSALFTPEFAIVGEALAAMTETVFTAFMATIISVPIAFVISFAAARNVMATSPTGKTIYVLLRAVLNIMRSMEPIIWAIIFSVWVGIGPFAGMLALVVHTIASLSKQYSEQIEDVNNGPIEAISATGANRIQVLWFAIVPQCLIPFLSFTIYRWDINVRMATVIGIVGGGGIGYLLTQYQGLSKYHEVGTLIIIITLVVWILDVISARVRAALK